MARCFSGGTPKRSPSEPHPVWQCGKPQPSGDNSNPELLLQAVRDGSLGFSFSGGGFLLAYHAGAYKALSRLGLLAPGSHVGGSSAGAIIAACISAGLEPDIITSAVTEVAAECQEKVMGRLGKAVKRQLDKHLPEDAHERCTGTTFIGITKLKFPGAGVINPKVVSKFEQREDLLQALLSSSHIPILSDGSMTMSFKGYTVIDGGISVMMPLPPGPKHVVKVSCMPLAALQQLKFAHKEHAMQNIQIAMGHNTPWPYTVEQTFQWALKPGPPHFISACIEHGQKDVLAWASEAGLMALLPAGKPPKELHASVEQQASKQPHDSSLVAEASSGICPGFEASTSVALDAGVTSETGRPLCPVPAAETSNSVTTIPNDSLATMETLVPSAAAAAAVATAH